MWMKRTERERRERERERESMILENQEIPISNSSVVFLRHKPKPCSYPDRPKNRRENIRLCASLVEAWRSLEG